MTPPTATIVSVCPTPQRANQGSALDRTVARHDRGDRDDVVRISGVVHPEEKPSAMMESKLIIKSKLLEIALDGQILQACATRGNNSLAETDSAVSSGHLRMCVDFETIA